MDLKRMVKKLTGLLKKYRFVALIAAVGVGLMLLPSRTEVPSQQKVEHVPITAEENTIEKNLEDVLCCLEGAGKVKVMLTVATGAQTVYQTDEQSTQSGDESSKKNETVIISLDGRNESALVCKVNSPKYLGAIVLCQGAESASVRLAIVEAVSKITGLSSDCIAVLKMK